MTRRAAGLLCIVGASAAATVALAAETEEDTARPAPPRNARVLELRALRPADAGTVHDRRRAVRVTVPPGWHRSAANLTPREAPPGPVVTVASFRPRVDERRACGSWPGMPQVGIGPRDVLLHVSEELDAQPNDLPARPARFRLLQQVRRPGSNDRFSVFPWRCLNRPGIVGVRTWFRAHGRLLWLTAVAGERTSTRLRRTLLGVAPSLRFGPPPPVIVRVDPPTGLPRTRFRLELVSTHRTGRGGRRYREYGAAVHGPHKVACVIENEAWFSYGPPGARLHATLDPRRTKGQRWCRGRFRGVVRYSDALCGRAGRCWRTYRRTAGRFSFTVR